MDNKLVGSAIFGRGLFLVRFHHKRQLARMQVLQFGARPFVQKVGVQPIRAQQRDPPLPLRPLKLGVPELSGEVGDLLIELMLGAQTVVTGESVDGEIADEESSDGVKAQRGKKRTQPFASDHVSTMACSLLTPF
jgi:hypothetical protein